MFVVVVIVVDIVNNNKNNNNNKYIYMAPYAQLLQRRLESIFLKEKRFQILIFYFF